MARRVRARRAGADGRLGVLGGCRALRAADRVITIDDMAKKHRSHGSAEQWKGDAVGRKSGDVAEAGADRAEGNEPVPLEAESERARHGDLRTEPVDPHHRPARDGDPEEDTAAVAEAHQARDAHERPPRGKL